NTSFSRDWSSDVCSSDLAEPAVHLTGQNHLVVAQQIAEHHAGPAVQAAAVVVLRVADRRARDRFRLVPDLVLVMQELGGIGEREDRKSVEYGKTIGAPER